MEAVKQGSATVGVKSKTHAVLVALKRASSELAAHQKKIIPIDTHIAISISGKKKYFMQRCFFNFFFYILSKIIYSFS